MRSWPRFRAALVIALLAGVLPTGPSGQTAGLPPPYVRKLAAAPKRLNVGAQAGGMSGAPVVHQVAVALVKSQP